MEWLTSAPPRGHDTVLIRRRVAPSTGLFKQALIQTIVIISIKAWTRRLALSGTQRPWWTGEGKGWKSLRCHRAVLLVFCHGAVGGPVAAGDGPHHLRRSRFTLSYGLVGNTTGDASLPPLASAPCGRPAIPRCIGVRCLRRGSRMAVPWIQFRGACVLKSVTRTQLCQVVMLGLSLRMVDWAFWHEPLRRRVEPDSRNVYLRALDLATTLRGVGWTVRSPESSDAGRTC
jgi:hypothetical protein